MLRLVLLLLLLLLLPPLRLLVPPLTSSFTIKGRATMVMKDRGRGGGQGPFSDLLCFVPP
jgi:hypothetical protein